jgi:hypothetical protein
MGSGYVANVLEENAASIFRVEISVASKYWGWK